MGLGKRVMGGASVIAVAGAAGRLLALLTAPILSHLLSPEAYGVAALANTAVALASVLALRGMEMGYMRSFLHSEEGERPAVERFCWRSTSLASVVIAVAAALAWYVIGSRWSPQYHEDIALFSLIAVMLAVAVQMANTRVQLAGNYARLASATLLSAIVGALVSIGVALFWRADVWALLFGAVSTSAAMLLRLGLPSSKVFFTASRLPGLKKRHIVSLGIATSVTAPLYWVISSADRWYLAANADEAAVGIYAVASSLALASFFVNNSITSTWLPEASRIYQEKSSEALEPLARLWERLVVLLGIAWLAQSAAGGDALHLLTASKFHSGAAFIPWLAGGVFFYGVTALANTSYFLANRMKVVGYCWIAGGVSSIGLNSLVVPQFGGLGAAIAQCASYALIAYALSVASPKAFKLPINRLRVCSVMSLLLIAGLAMSPPWAGNSLSSLLLKFPVGLAVAGTAVFLVAPQWVRLAGEQVRNALGR